MIAVNYSTICPVMRLWHGAFFGSTWSLMTRTTCLAWNEKLLFGVTKDTFESFISIYGKRGRHTLSRCFANAASLSASLLARQPTADFNGDPHITYYFIILIVFNRRIISSYFVICFICLASILKRKSVYPAYHYSRNQPARLISSNSPSSQPDPLIFPSN